MYDSFKDQGATRADANKWAKEYMGNAEKEYKAQLKQQETAQKAFEDGIVKQKERLQQALNSFGNADPKFVKSANERLKYLDNLNFSDWNDPVQKLSECESLTSKIVQNMETSHKLSATTISQQAEAQAKLYANNLSESESNAFSKDYYKKQIDSITERDKVFSDMRQYYQEQEKKYAQVQDNFDDYTYDLQTAKMSKKLNAYDGQDTKALRNARDAYKSYVDEIESMQTKINNDEFVDDKEFDKKAESIERASKKFQNSMKIVQLESSKTLGDGVAQKSADNVQKYINANTKAWSKYKTQLEEVRDAYKSVTTVEEKASVDSRFQGLKASISAEGLTGKSVISDIVRGFKNIGQFAATYGLIQNVAVQVPSQIIEAVRDVNAAQIELRKVSDASDLQLNTYWDQAAESAKKYGAAISDVISSTADWSRLGRLIAPLCREV